MKPTTKKTIVAVLTALIAVAGAIVSMLNQPEVSPVGGPAPVVVEAPVVLPAPAVEPEPVAATVEPALSDTSRPVR